MSWSETQYAIDEITKVTGIPPQNMSKFNVTSETDENGVNKATITCTPPENTIIQGMLLCTVGGVRILRKENKASISPEDGVLIAEVPYGTNFEYVDENLSNDTTYYYSFFPYSDHGVFNYSDYNKKYVTFGSGEIPPEPEIPKEAVWAFDQDFSNLDPETTISYPSGYLNENFSPMMTNESNGEVTAGDWLSFLQKVLKNRPCMVKKNMELDYELNSFDYSKKIDGTDSDYNNLDYDGGSFAWINKIWTKETYSNDGLKRRVEYANFPADGFSPMGFINKNLEEVEGLWIPMGYGDANARILVSGTNTYSKFNSISDIHQTIENKWGADNGAFLGSPVIFLLRDLIYMMFKSTNVLLKCGYGINRSTVDSDFVNSNITKGSVPGWYGSENGEKNKFFHSQVLGSRLLDVVDPFFVTQPISGRIFISKGYRFTASPSTIYTQTNCVIEKKLNGYIQYAEKLISTGDPLLGSIPNVSFEHPDDYPTKPSYGSSVLGLCSPSWWYYASSSGVNANRWCYVTNSLGGPMSFANGTQNIASLSNYSGIDENIIGSGFAVLLIPNVGYSPF